MGSFLPFPHARAAAASAVAAFKKQGGLRDQRSACSLPSSVLHRIGHALATTESQDGMLWWNSPRGGPKDLFLVGESANASMRTALRMVGETMFPADESLAEEFVQRMGVASKESASPTAQHLARPSIARSSSSSSSAPPPPAAATAAGILEMESKRISSNPSSSTVGSARKDRMAAVSCSIGALVAEDEAWLRANSIHGTPRLNAASGNRVAMTSVGIRFALSRLVAAGLLIARIRQFGAGRVETNTLRLGTFKIRRGATFLQLWPSSIMLAYEQSSNQDLASPAGSKSPRASTWKDASRKHASSSVVLESSPKLEFCLDAPHKLPAFLSKLPENEAMKFVKDSFSDAGLGAAISRSIGGIMAERGDSRLLKKQNLRIEALSKKVQSASGYMQTLPVLAHSRAALASFSATCACSEPSFVAQLPADELIWLPSSMPAIPLQGLPSHVRNMQTKRGIMANIEKPPTPVISFAIESVQSSDAGMLHSLDTTSSSLASGDS